MAEGPFDALIEAKAAAYGVSASLVKAIVAAESSFNPRAYRAEPRIQDASYGLMQVLFRTARGLGYTGEPEGLYDPATNVDLGTKYIAYQLGRYQGDVPSAIAAYNSGTVRRTAGGQFLNQSYVNRVLGFLAKFQQLSPPARGPAPATQALPAMPIRVQASRSPNGEFWAQLETFVPREQIPWLVTGVGALLLAFLSPPSRGRK